MKTQLKHWAGGEHPINHWQLGPRETVCCVLSFKQYWAIFTVPGFHHERTRGRTPTIENDTRRHPVLPYTNWGGRILTLHLNYMAGCTRGLQYLTGDWQGHFSSEVCMTRVQVLERDEMGTWKHGIFKQWGQSTYEQICPSLQVSVGWEIRRIPLNPHAPPEPAVRKSGGG